MRRQKRPPFRNKLDLADRTQVRVVARRLGVSEPELAEIVGRIGNSIAAISKEVSLQRAGQSRESANVPPTAAVDRSSKPEQEISAEATT